MPRMMATDARLTTFADPATPGDALLPRVAFDATMARINRVGTGIYTRKLVQALQPLMGEQLLPIECGFARPFNNHKTVRDRFATLVHDVWWTQAGILDAVKRCRANLLHVPAMLAPMRSSVPLVVTIHDLAILRFPRKFRRWHRSFGQYIVRRLAHTADALVAVSVATKADLVELLGVPPERVTVIPCGIGSGFAPLPNDDPRLESVRSRYRLPAEYAITVGAIEPRKNLGRLLKAVKMLAARRELAHIQLVHAGPVGWHAEDVPQTVKDLGLASHVRFLGYVPNEDLAALYQLARVSVYPSLFEGFGLPVLEAMASGCPVITSNCSSLPEVAGDAAVLVDPTNVESIADGLARVWFDDDFRRDRIARGLSRAACFTWESTARQTLELYDRVLSAA